MPTKKGHTKYIEKPDKLYQLFEEYKKEIKDNPRESQDFVGKDGDEIIRKTERPLTIAGFKVYCYKHAGDIEAYWHNRDKKYSDYSSIVARIRDEIRQDQVEGGLVGAYNPNLTARLNGIKDHTENTSNHNVQLLSIDPLGDYPTTIEIEAKEPKKIEKNKNE